MKTIHLEPNQVPAMLRGGYSGRKFQAEICESVTVGNHQGYWDGGSRDVFHVIRTVDGARLGLSDVSQHPGNVQPGSVTYRVDPGYVVVEHSMFCGKDAGLRFYVNPADAVAMLPAPGDPLTLLERLILHATKDLKSSYGGRDRYQMAVDYPSQFGRDFEEMTPSRDQWDEAKSRLIGRKLLNKAGAITTSGKNAIA